MNKTDAIPDETWVNEFVEAAATGGTPPKLKDLPAGRRLLEADADGRSVLATIAIQKWVQAGENGGGPRQTLVGVFSQLLAQGELTQHHLASVATAAAKFERVGRYRSPFPFKPMIVAIERLVTRDGSLGTELRTALHLLLRAVTPRPLTAAERREHDDAVATFTSGDSDDDASPGVILRAFASMEQLRAISTSLVDEQRVIDRLTRLLDDPALGGPSPGGVGTPAPVDVADAVSAAIAADAVCGGPAAAPGWATLFAHARRLTSPAPSDRWLQLAAAHVAAVGTAPFVDRFTDWVANVGRRTTVDRADALGQRAESTLLAASTADMLKGLAWSAAASGTVGAATPLAALATACFRKVAGHGQRCPKVGNAAAAALAELASRHRAAVPAAAAQLTRLRETARHPSARTAVDKALRRLSGRTGLTPDELAEMAVPTCGFQSGGLRQQTVGPWTAELRVVNSRSVMLEWIGPTGRRSKSAPAAVRTGHAAQVKQLRRAVKEASVVLTTTALRLEKLLAAERSWPVLTFVARYVEHALVGTLGRRLIWRLNGRAAAWSGSGWVNANENLLTTDSNTVVTPWHPAGEAVQAVLAWRRWLERHEIVQPFKQAHREIYVLTDAERETRTYSNRFAAHVLRQHQLAALCQQRGWSYRLQGAFDSGDSVPTLELPAHGLKVQFFVEPAVGGGTSAAGIFLYVTTDQIRFTTSAGDPVPLDQIPPLVLSEILRDVDLFVGVASVGNDPAWQDGGPEGRYQNYWQSYSFGDLSETAKTRRAVLQTLLPRLTKLREKWALTDKFLVIRGTLRSYKIHLGSGNILMEPNDQYLCIVPRRSASQGGVTDGAFLPFEGDATLSIILSKAFLLAADDKIADPTITRQISPS